MGEAEWRKAGQLVAFFACDVVRKCMIEQRELRVERRMRDAEFL
jgi:hypothetical protein